MALFQALESLDIATAADCLAFAKKMTQEGILSLDKLKKVPEADAIEVLGAAGMKKLQIRTVMESIAFPIDAPVSPAPLPTLQPAFTTFSESPTCFATLQGHSSGVRSVAFHPSAPILATASDDKSAKLWRLNSDCTGATCFATLQGHIDLVRSVAFHPSAPILVTGSNDDTAKLWRLNSDCTEATCVATLKGYNETVRYVAFHPSAPILAFASDAKFAKLWRLNFDNTAEPSTQKSAAIASLVPLLNAAGVPMKLGSKFLFTDGSSTYYCGRSLGWKAIPGSDGTCGSTTQALCNGPNCQDCAVVQLKMHGALIMSVAFHPSAPILATSSEDKTAKLWRLNSDCTHQTCVATLKGHGDGLVHSVTFHPSAPILATASEDKTVKLWRLNSSS